MNSSTGSGGPVRNTGSSTSAVVSNPYWEFDPKSHTDVTADAVQVVAPRRIQTLVKNDYNKNYGDTGEYPSNYIRDHEPEKRFANYAPLQRLVELKDLVRRQRAHPPLSLRVQNLLDFDFSTLKTQFDVLYVDPPWEEYAKRAVGSMMDSEVEAPWAVEDLLKIPVDQFMAVPSFCFIWAGSDHLEDARKVLNGWGYRRCEDIVWLKQNIKSVQDRGKQLADLVYPESILCRTKEHCLLGIKGNVKRGKDSHLIHANVDIDAIVWEQTSLNSYEKPKEVYEIIERFCLSRRRVQLFGGDRDLRPGWVTVGKDLRESDYDADKYNEWTDDLRGVDLQPKGYPDIKSYVGGRYLGSTVEIEGLRPKSPTNKSLGR